MDYSPEGLRWIAHGFAALGLSDHEILENEFVVYDALYAECQQRIAGGEGATPAYRRLLG
jgi:hypothetical protein